MFSLRGAHELWPQLLHLLACLLARMWSASEAIAIWSELVTARKARLEETLRGLEFQASSLIASRIEVSHESLAEWDASARSVCFAPFSSSVLSQVLCHKFYETLIEKGISEDQNGR